MYKRRDAKGRMARAGSFRPPGHTDSEAECSESEGESAQPAKRAAGAGIDGMWARGATLPDQESSRAPPRAGGNPSSKRSASPGRRTKSKAKEESSDSDSSEAGKKKKKKKSKSSKKASKKSKRKKSKKSKRVKSSSGSGSSDSD
jgi:hypothetical protein